MKNLLKLALCSSVMIAGTAFTANASTIKSVQASDASSVVVQRSGDFEIASANTTLSAGDSVYALNDATANIALTSDCNVTLAGNEVLTVTATNLQDCASMYSLEKFNAEHLTELKSSNIIASSATFLSILAAAGVIAGITIALDDDDEDFPPSP